MRVQVQLVRRATQSLVEPLLRRPSAVECEDGDQGGDVADTALQLSFSWLSKRFFALASDRATPERNRAHLYELQQRAEALADEEGEEQEKKDGQDDEAEEAEGQQQKNRRSGCAAVASHGSKAAQAVQVDAFKNLITRGTETRKGAAKERVPTEEATLKGSASWDECRSIANGTAIKRRVTIAAAETSSGTIAKAKRSKKVPKEIGAVVAPQAAKTKTALVPEALQPDFCAAHHYEGSRSGFVFKKGSKGVGYYRDKPPQTTYRSHKAGSFRMGGCGGRSGSGTGGKQGRKHDRR